MLKNISVFNNSFVTYIYTPITYFCRVYCNGCKPFYIPLMFLCLFLLCISVLCNNTTTHALRSGHRPDQAPSTRSIPDVGQICTLPRKYIVYFLSQPYMYVLNIPQLLLGMQPRYTIT